MIIYFSRSTARSTVDIPSVHYDIKDNTGTLLLQSPFGSENGSVTSIIYHLDPKFETCVTEGILFRRGQ